ncbi:MAG TPA: hypothetical protein VGT40_23680 [Methylomirabilota bacterium]|nr:hypothetical protein [Methylomirabilota bacterium]
MDFTSRPRSLVGWTLLGAGIGLLIGCVRLAILAAYWPHGRKLLWYFVFGFLDTVIIAAIAGAVIGVLVRQSRRN